MPDGVDLSPNEKTEAASRQRELDAARAIFPDCGREITQQFSTMSTNVTLATGTIAALLVLASTDIRNQPKHVLAPWDLPALSSPTLIVFCLSLVPLVRWLSRSATAYQNLERFQIIQSYARALIMGDGSIEFTDFEKATKIYLDEWQSPSTFVSTLWKAAKYNGFYLLIPLLVGGIGWGFVSVDSVEARWVATAILVFVGLLEVCMQRGNAERYFKPYRPAPAGTEAQPAATGYVATLWKRNFNWPLAG